MDIVRAKKASAHPRLKKTAGAVVALATLLCTCTFVWRSSASAATAVDKGSLWVETVRRGELVRQVPVQGALVPEHVQWLSAQTAARVARIVVRPGEEVTPESVVVLLENTDVELGAIEAARQAASADAKLIELDVKTTADEKQQAATLAALRAELLAAGRHAESANRLAGGGILSENDRKDAVELAAGLGDRFGTEEARRNVLVSGRARQLEAQRTELASIREIAAFRKKQLEALTIRAGVRGIVQDVPLENGQWVAIGTVLAKVAEPGQLKAEVRVSEAYVRDLQPGLGVRFEAVGSAPSTAGKIVRIDPAVVAGSVKLEVRLEGTPDGLRADQRVSGYVEIERIENVLHVARPAGLRDGATGGVFRLEPDGVHAVRVNVQLGRGSAREVEITAGLREGDSVVVSDVSAWDSVARVRLK